MTDAVGYTQPATISSMWLPVLSAFLGIIAFLPFNFYPAAFIFLVPLLIFFVREDGLWRLIAGVNIFRIIFGLGTAYYALEPIFWATSLLIFLGLPVTIWIIKKYGLSCGSPTSTKLLLIFLPFLWTLFDLLQAQYSLMPTFIFSAGNALGSSPFLGLATFGGFIGLTFFVALINILITALVMQKPRNRFAIALVVLLLLGWQISNYELHQNTEAYSALPNSFTVASVSTNTAFTSAEFPNLVQELSQQKSDLIILPENLFNSHVGRPTSYMGIARLARELHTNVLATYDTTQDGKKYNTATLFNAQGDITGTHNKNRLTFIGEYWPFGSWHLSFYDWLRARDPRISTYAVFNPENAISAGERNLLSATFGKNAVPFAAPICLEMHYPTDLSAYKTAGARFIVNPSSNRWISGGLNHFLYLIGNMKKIESVALQLPIISSGVNDFAGITLPSGVRQPADVQHKVLSKNYTIFFGTIRY